jgi:hypothetical protein
MSAEFRPEKLDYMARLFGEEGLTQFAADLAWKAREIRTQAKDAVDLVERSRRLDQNALGMIAALSEQAALGSPRAAISCMLIDQYCLTHPMPQLGPLGEMPIEQATDPHQAFRQAVKQGLITSPFSMSRAA